MKNLIIAITGASGAIYAKTLLEYCNSKNDITTHLIISKAAYITIKAELGVSAEDIIKLSDKHYPAKDISACISSGSYKTDGMIILPCSIRTMSQIATANSDNLISRSADVILKERKKLLLAVRETPLHSIHLNNMKLLSDMGAIIYPPVPAFYNNPKNLQEMVNHTVGRILDYFEIDNDLKKIWQGLKN
ncbi:MAG: UbiX family flavin prenyltransferase [Rickettsiales bacterium]|nr:UbiX family flavin prenyltransferase [Rickettsiales bacterium]